MREGLEYYWQQQYSFAQRDFSEVITLFPDHSEAAKLIQDSQEHIVKGEDQSGTAILGAGLIVVIVAVHFACRCWRNNPDRSYG